MDKKYYCEFLCFLVWLSGKDFNDSRSGNADVYKHEIPGGQYTNLQFQVSAQLICQDMPNVKSKSYMWDWEVKPNRSW